MGILNVTPDSFSDGGTNLSVSDAVNSALRMIDEGADLIDIGGESTRPGASPVSQDEELKRVIPAVKSLTQRGIAVSVDTSKVAVARQSLEVGAVVINDVTALAATGMADLCAEYGCTVCLMHMKGTPETMQNQPAYVNVVSEVETFLRLRAEFAQSQGIHSHRIWVDPGIGFGKTVEQNLLLIKDLGPLTSMQFPVLVGVSRKAFIGRILGSDEPLDVLDRLEGSLAIQTIAQLSGARIIRTHDVKASRRTVDMVSKFK